MPLYKSEDNFCLAAAGVQTEGMLLEKMIFISFRSSHHAEDLRKRENASL